MRLPLTLGSVVDKVIDHGSGTLTRCTLAFGVEVADLGGTGAVHVVDHDLGVELDDLDARTGVGVEVLGCELPVKPGHDQPRYRKHHNDNQGNPGSFDDAG